MKTNQENRLEPQSREVLVSLLMIREIGIVVQS